MISIVGEKSGRGGRDIQDSLLFTSTGDYIEMIFRRDGTKTKRQTILVYRQPDQRSKEKQSKEEK